MESMEKIGVFILSAEAAPLVEELIGASKNVGELYDFLEIYMRANIRKCSMGIYLTRKHTLKDLNNSSVHHMMVTFCMEFVMDI